MTTIVKANLSQAVGESLLTDLYLQKSRYYYGLGRSYTWGEGDNPISVIDTEKYEQESRRDILYLKKLESSSISFIIPRINYTAGQIWDSYDDSISMEGKRFYVMTADFNVYKCISNNNGRVSTVEPFGNSSYQVEYGDGYVWKYVYAIPPALRNKFLNPSYMPVYNALTERYYNRGSINAVNILSSGTGLPGSTYITVDGDGYLEDNPYELKTFAITGFGAGYTTTPTVSTADHVSPSMTFNAGTAVTLISGQYVKVSDTSGVRFYKALNSGTTSTIIPTHYYQTTNNGDVALKHIGSKPKLSLTAVAGAIGAVTVVEPGFGYISVPSVTKTGSPGTGAVLVAEYTNGSIYSIGVSVQGSGYTSDAVVVGEPYSCSSFVGGATYTINTIIKYVNGADTYYYRVDTGGVASGSVPTHTTGTAANGATTLTVIAKRARATALPGRVGVLTAFSEVKEVTISNGGSGYTGATVSFIGGSPTVAATGTVILSGGSVSRIVITHPGYGYTSAPTVSVTGGAGVNFAGTVVTQYGYGYTGKVPLVISAPDNVSGTQATGDTTATKTNAIVKPNIVDGNLVGVSIEDGGTGYTNASMSVIGGTGARIEAIFAPGDLSSIQAQTELLAIPRSLSSIYITEPSSNISSIQVTLDGDGTGASVEPIVIDGVLDRIRVLSEGTNYSYINVNIVVDNGATVQPTARAILSPIKGHGSNPIRELYAKSVALATKMARESNNGYILNNEFRQICILKNPLKYDTSYMTNGKSESACYNVSVSTTTGIQKNVMMTNDRDSGIFRVIDLTSTTLLLSGQSDKYILPSDVLRCTINNVTYNVTATSVTDPQVDKYSGDLLFIDNLSTFTPTENQAVNINTVINLI